MEQAHKDALKQAILAANPGATKLTPQQWDAIIAAITALLQAFGL